VTHRGARDQILGGMTDRRSHLRRGPV